MKEWKTERQCSECGDKFMPHIPKHVTCSVKCRRRRCYRIAQKRDNHRTLDNYNGKTYKRRLRARFFEMYGEVCVCCGEVEKIFLTVDHKQDDGHIERKRLGGGEPYRTLRVALKKHQPERYQTLCFNCNLGRKLNGGICPHRIDSI